MLASLCTRMWDVKSFIFCVHAGGRLTSWGLHPSYLQGPFCPRLPYTGTLHPVKKSRNLHNLAYQPALFNTGCDKYPFSQTVRDWNKLPLIIANISNINNFKQEAFKHLRIQKDQLNCYWMRQTYAPNCFSFGSERALRILFQIQIGQTIKLCFIVPFVPSISPSHELLS